MYVKIPHLEGENNINLTIGYVQEEVPTHKYEEKEEDNKQFFFISSLNGARCGCVA